MSSICEPGAGCEMCPMNTLPLEQQFSVGYDLETGAVYSTSQGELGDEVELTDQIAVTANEVGITIRSGLCAKSPAEAEDPETVRILVQRSRKARIMGVLFGAKISSAYFELSLLDEGHDPAYAKALSTVVDRVSLR